MSVRTTAPSGIVAAPLVAQPSLPRRVLHMTALWTFFGTVMGLGMGLMEGGWIGVAAHVVAGLMIMPLLGMVLGLIGGPWRDAFLGAVSGAILGLAAGTFLGNPNPVQIGYACLLVGGMVGATFLENSRRMRRGLQYLWMWAQGPGEPLSVILVGEEGKAVAA